MTTFDKAVFSADGAALAADPIGRHVVRISAAETGGRLGLFEAEVPPGEGPPPHVHDREEETFRVLAGRFAFWCEDERVELGEGGVIFIPRGSVHRFQNVGATTGRLMVVMTPGGFEGFFGTLAAEQAQDFPTIAAIGERFHLRFVMDGQTAA